MGGREQLLQRAQLAQQAECDDDMASAMKAGTEPNEPLSSEDGSPPLWPPRMWPVPGDAPGGPAAAPSRKPCRREREEAGESKAYREEIEKELETMFDEVLALLGQLLIENGSDFQVESKVFNLQMKGGSYVTWQSGFRGEKHSVAEASLAAYTEAFEISTEHMRPTRPGQLGPAFNFAKC